MNPAEQSQEWRAGWIAAATRIALLLRDRQPTNAAALAVAHDVVHEVPDASGEGEFAAGPRDTCGQCGQAVRPTETVADRFGRVWIYDHCGLTWTTDHERG